MVKFTKDVAGVEVIQSGLPIIFEEVGASRPTKMHKKPWKGARQRNRTHEVRHSELSAEEKVQRRQQHSELKQLMAEAREQREERRRQGQQARELKKKRQEESESRGIQQAQVIKDVSKTRKWSKKAREKLMKMPREMFEKYLNSTK